MKGANKAEGRKGDRSVGRRIGRDDKDHQDRFVGTKAG